MKAPLNKRRAAAGKTTLTKLAPEAHVTCCYHFNPKASHEKVCCWCGDVYEIEPTTHGKLVPKARWR